MQKNQNKSFVSRLREGYEAAKMPLAYIMLVAALLLDSPIANLLPEKFVPYAQSTVLIAMALILLEVLFKIYDKVAKQKKELNIINSSELFKNIADIVEREKNVSIKYLGVAGRHGWFNVLDKLLNENNPESLLANRAQFKIDMALLDPQKAKENNPVFQRFKAVDTISESVLQVSKHIEKVAPGSNLNLYFYDYMPNMLGFLVNENYLFLTHTYWEYLQGELTLRAGGSDYFVYDKNDDFGGQEVIHRFNGWFNYITSNYPNQAAIDANKRSQNDHVTLSAD